MSRAELIQSLRIGTLADFVVLAGSRNSRRNSCGHNGIVIPTGAKRSGGTCGLSVLARQLSAVREQRRQIESIAPSAFERCRNSSQFINQKPGTVRRSPRVE
jgi:hypothetical protein